MAVGEDEGAGEGAGEAMPLHLCIHMAATAAVEWHLWGHNLHLEGRHTCSVHRSVAVTRAVVVVAEAEAVAWARAQAP